jgi:CubicO group peptidase (beta-lactamase class C family)
MNVFVSTGYLESTQPTGSTQETDVRGTTAYKHLGFVGDAASLYPLREVCYNANIDQTNQPFPAASGTLVPAYDQQDRVFAAPFKVLEDAITDKMSPAASVAVLFHEKLVALKSLGRFTYDSDSPAVSPETIFDLASLTKAVATTTVAMILYQRGLLDLDLPVISVVPEFRTSDPRRDEVTLRMLLAHSSGLPAYEKLFLRAETKQSLLREAFQTPLVAEPGDRAEYSDIGFIILGISLERIAEETLDHFCSRAIFGPLGMLHTTFKPPLAWHAEIPPTANDRSFRLRMIQGEVQDENASVLGGVAGHAGLFSTAGDLALFSNAMLHGGKPMVEQETVSLFTRRESSPAGTSRALGWDTPSSPSQSGKYFSPSSYGHLGYTGTSLWIDPERRLSVVLLTNRTWPDCTNQTIKLVRPRFYDAVIEALEHS